MKHLPILSTLSKVLIIAILLVIGAAILASHWQHQEDQTASFEPTVEAVEAPVAQELEEEETPEPEAIGTPVLNVPAFPEHLSEHVVGTFGPNPAPITATTSDGTPTPITNTIYIEKIEGEAVELQDNTVAVVFYQDGNFMIFGNSIPDSQQIEVSYLFGEEWVSLEARDVLHTCALADNFIACLENPPTTEEVDGGDLPFVSVTAEFDGPICEMAIDEIMVIPYEEYNTIDMVVHPDQGAVIWSSTNMSEEEFWRQHSYRNDDGCSVLTLGHNPEHPSGINFVVENSSGEIIWDQDLWLGD